GVSQLTGVGDREAPADRARPRAWCCDDRRDDALLAILFPAVDLGKDLFHAACLLSMPASTAPSSSRLRRLWPGRKRSTKGSAARIPPARGWYSGFPFNGLTQTTANAARASLAISRATRSGSSRSQPSETTTTTAPRASA